MASCRLFVVCLFLFVSSVSVSSMLLQRSASRATPSKLPTKLLPEVKTLVSILNTPQSAKSKERVESLITILEGKADNNPNMYRKQIKQGNSYRTLWSSVTSSSLLGQILEQKPSVVLNGPSWQTISADGQSSENIVQWKLGGLSIRMIGLASLAPLKSKVGYELVIRGLEFRVNKARVKTKIDSSEPTENTIIKQQMEIPERFAKMGEDARVMDSYILGPFLLKEDEALRNGIGTLEVLYNDGLVRITEDKIQRNKYIHALEPYGDILLESS